MNSEQAYYQRPGPVEAAAIALPLLDIIAVALRFQARKTQKQGLKWDDWLLIPATLLTLGIGIAVAYGVEKGAVGYPIQLPADFAGNWLETKTDQITLSWLIQWAFDMMLPVTLGLIKISFLLFYQRIFAVRQKTFADISLLVLIVLVSLWMTAFFFTSLFQCRSNFWANYGSAAEIQANCIDTTQMVFVLSITDFITDVIIICIPIPLVWRLNLSLRKKVAVTGVFLLGAVALAASLVRLVMMTEIITNSFKSNADGLLSATQFLYWGLVESGVGITAACLPTLQFLFRSWSRSSTESNRVGMHDSQPAPHRHSSHSKRSHYSEQPLNEAVQIKPQSSHDGSDTEGWVHGTRNGYGVRGGEVYNMGGVRAMETV
ncbi:plasma membrane protein Pth11-like protein [Hypomontagnella monticulosa]|nr:plasma membrane protein Pth11-like protein [Hypomontagnella monticulosa]